MISNTINPAGRITCRFIYIITAAMVLFSVSSCLRDDVSPSGGEDALVRLTIRTPGVSSPKAAATRSADAEYLIEDVKVIVLEKANDGKYYYRYMADGQYISQENAQKTTFSALLKGTARAVKLLLVANYGDGFDNYTPSRSDTEEDLRSGLKATFISPSPTIPMYGEAALDKLSTATTNTVSVTMLRALAKADVKTELSSLSNSFEITSVHIYRARNMVQVMPDLSALTDSSTPKVSAPSVPEGVGTIEKISITAEDPTSVGNIYLPECMSVTEEAQQLKGVTCLVVGGRYNGESMPTYYRVDFNSGDAAHPYGQLLRNHRYEIIVTRVTGRGWEDPDDAANNRATMIEADIQMWEDHTIYMISGDDNYLGVSSREVIISYRQGAHKTMYVQSSVPYTISWEGGSEEVSPGGEQIKNDHFSAYAQELPQSGDDVSMIVITNLGENRSGSDHKSRLILAWDRWELTVDVTQLDYLALVERAVRVASAWNGTVGHLGGPGGGATGTGMRNLLDNKDYFSPRGVVSFFQGFYFTISPEQATFKEADGTNDHTFLVNSLLHGADVVHMGFDNQLSEYSARRAMEWLAAKPNRVLVVNADAPATSHNLIRRDKPYAPLAWDALWYYNAENGGHYNVANLDNTGGKFLTWPLTDGVNNEFIDGVFGRVADNSPVDIADEYFGYATEYLDEITPLVGVNGYPGYMSVGIDKQKGIVYLGDANLYQSGIMSANPATSMHDRLWANVWAWISHRVIWGEYED